MSRRKPMKRVVKKKVAIKTKKSHGFIWLHPQYEEDDGYAFYDTAESAQTAAEDWANNMVADDNSIVEDSFLILDCRYVRKGFGETTMRIGWSNYDGD